MLTKSDWPLYVGSASLPFSSGPGSTKWPGSIGLAGATTAASAGEEATGVTGASATAVGGGPGGGG